MPFAITAPVSQPFVVLIGPDDGSNVHALDADDESMIDPNVQVISLTRSAGGHRLDHVTLNYSLGLAGVRLVDVETPFEFSRRVQVWTSLHSGSGGVANGTTTFTDAAAHWTSAVVGEFISIAGKGTFEITAFNSATSLELDGSPSTDTGLSWSIKGEVLFSGELAQQDAHIDKGGEYVSLLARVEPWHFGGPVSGPAYREAQDLIPQETGLPIIFNPEIDGRIEPNMSDHVNVDEDWHYWVDPESVRTDAAKIVQDEPTTIASWDLANAVFSLCWTANPFEDLVLNPTLAELEDVFTDPPAMRNIKLSRGKRLPDLLDELLPRFGYNWYLEVVIHPDDVAVPEGSGTGPRYVNKIRVFQIGAGSEVTVFMQRPANPPPNLSLTATNVVDLDATWNIADLRNEIIGQGSLMEVEATFELYRAWPEADDILSADDLRKTEETTTDNPDLESQFKDKPNVWRRWVLNEAGDYCSLRTVVAPIPATPFKFGKAVYAVSSVYDGIAGSAGFRISGDHTEELFSGEELEIKGSTGNDAVYTITTFAFGAGETAIDVAEAVPDDTADGTLCLGGLLGVNNLVKRRRFHPCLTWGGDLERRDVFVQYRDPDIADPDAPGAWKALPKDGGDAWTNVSFKVLEKECGIYFNGATPPPELVDMVDDARLRITATVRGDQRLEKQALRALVSPNANTIPILVDLSDRFHYRVIQQNAPYQSALKDETYGSDAVDDSSALQSYVTALRGIEQAAIVTAHIILHGITTEYQIGDLVTSVAGRDISFNRNNFTQEERLYPQITAINYDRRSQRTTLRVETYDFTPAKLKKLSL